MSNIIKSIAKALQNPAISILKAEEMFQQAVMINLNKDPTKSLDIAVE